MKKFLVYCAAWAGFYVGSMVPALAAPPREMSAASAGAAQARQAGASALGNAAPSTDRLRSGRALWIKRDQLVSPERIIRCVDEAAANGYTVLFVQVRGRGDAWYRSEIVPEAELIANRKNDDGSPFDPLDLLLRRAHARKLEVHAWVNAFLIWSGSSSPMLSGHVLNDHPDWVSVDATGRRLSAYSAAEIKRANIEGVFLSAGNPAVTSHLRDVIREIAENYPVDGIHLDYIRTPLVDTGYDAATRASFMAEHGVDPWKLRHGTQELHERFGAEGVARLDATWKSWRAEQVTKFVAQVRNDLNALDHPVVLSAAVFPNCKTAPVDVGQDWMTWCREGYVDMVVPMFYSKSTETVLRQLELAQREMPLDVILYAGLAVYNQSLQSAAEKALKCRRIGADGICFFPYDTLAERPGSLSHLSRMAFGTTGGNASARTAATAR